MENVQPLINPAASTQDYFDLHISNNFIMANGKILTMTRFLRIFAKKAINLAGPNQISRLRQKFRVMPVSSQSDAILRFLRENRYELYEGFCQMYGFSADDGFRRTAIIPRSRQNFEDKWKFLIDFFLSLTEIDFEVLSTGM